MGNTLSKYIPQSPFPSPIYAIQIYPLFPQIFDHEFLRIKYPFPFWFEYPVATKPWSGLVPHFPVYIPFT